MGDFRFLNYHTEYSVKGTANKKMYPEACYAYVFHHNDYQDNRYEIRIYKGLQMAKKGKDNNCFLEKNELHHHISLLKKIYGFSFTIEEAINKDLIPYYVVKIHIKGPNIIHRYILTWVRYTYEYPYNLYTIDLYKTKASDEFKFVNPFTIFNIITAYCGNGSSGHMLTSPGFEYKNYRTNWIKNKLFKLNSHHNNNVSDIFERINDNNYWEKEHGEIKIDTKDDWNNNYEERLKEYIKIYNNIKDKK